MSLCLLFFFFFNDTATTEIYTLSLHDALPIWSHAFIVDAQAPAYWDGWRIGLTLSLTRANRLGYFGQGNGTLYARDRDRKSTRLNSSHGYISYAVFCLKKKKTHPNSSP